MATVTIVYNDNYNNVQKETKRKFSTPKQAKGFAEEFAQVIADLHLDEEAGDYYEWVDDTDGNDMTQVQCGSDASWYDVIVEEES